MAFPGPNSLIGNLKVLDFLQPRLSVTCCQVNAGDSAPVTIPLGPQISQSIPCFRGIRKNHPNQQPFRKDTVLTCQKGSGPAPLLTACGSEQAITLPWARGLNCTTSLQERTPLYMKTTILCTKGRTKVGSSIMPAPQGLIELWRLL